MSSPSGAADATLPKPGASDDKRGRIAPAAPGDSDTGQPVVDLPPMVEPIAEPFSDRPQRRSFLAPVTPAPEARAAPARQAPAAMPELVEPVAPAAMTAPEPAPAASPTKFFYARAQVSQWLAPVRRWWPAGRRKQALAAGGIVVAAAVLLIGMDVARLGPFAPARHYPTADAPKDPAGRLAYFQRGANAGDPNAEMQLAIIYAKGEGVAQDYATSATWFRAAANHGVARAQYDLGVMYERGRGVTVDLSQAAEWYLKAAQAGYPLAQYNLAVCYTKGQGIRRDLTEAALWYHRAAAQGVVQAMINLAVMYDKGDGVAASPVDAYAWYQAAGRRGDQSSARRAEDLYNSLAKLDQVRAEALAGDVANSIHDPAPGDGQAAASGTSTGGH